MTMEDFVKMLAAIRDDKVVLIPYQLHCDGHLRRLIESLGGTSEAVNYFEKVSEAGAPTIAEREKEYL